MMGFAPDPTEVVQNTALQIVEKLKSDNVDLVLLSAGCPTCHRTMALVQNLIETADIGTVALTVEPHITSVVGSPRSVYLRFPAGNCFGEGGKPIQQRAIVTSALQAAYVIETPGGVVELPFRWRRFPVLEQEQLARESDGPRHIHAEGLSDALDALVRKAHAYRAFLDYRVAEELATGAPVIGMPMAFAGQVKRVDDLVELLDTVTMDGLRSVLNEVASLELWASGEFV